MKALELGGGVYYVARGEDVDAGSNILAIITTTIILLFVHFETCKIPRCLISGGQRGEAGLEAIDRLVGLVQVGVVMNSSVCFFFCCS